VSTQRPYRVLVVDDDSSVLTTYQLILERHGYEVTACGTSKEAIQAIERRNFDAILCDYSLEDQHTGLEVINAARSRRADIPAVLLTGYATNETADEAAANNIGILFKPIEIDEFLATTSKMLRGDNEPDQKDNKKIRNDGAQSGKQRRQQQQSRGRGGTQRRSPGGTVET
jgi:DNA-binding NtrC family response regulator